MATAGSGDVLAGMLASLLVQQNHAPHPQPADRTAAAAVFLHGLLGELAASQRNEASVLAGDLIQTLTFDPLFRGQETLERHSVF